MVEGLTWLNELLTNSVNETSNAVIDFIIGIVFEVFGYASTLIKYKEVNIALGVVNLVASAFLLLLLMGQILNIHVLEIDGDPDNSPLLLLEKACIALAFIQMQSFLLVFLLDMAEKILLDMTGAVQYNFTSYADYVDAVDMVCANQIIVTLIMGLYAVGIGMFLWKGVKRGVELIFMKILFPLFCTDIVTVSREKFRSFFTSYLIIIFGYIIQVFAFKFSAVLLLNGSLLGLFSSLASLFFASSAPKWIEKYMYSTGIGKNAVNGARGAMYMIPQLIRMGK